MRERDQIKEDEMWIKEEMTYVALLEQGRIKYWHMGSNRKAKAMEAMTAIQREKCAEMQSAKLVFAA
ncbi:hypothetical protein RvY_12545 [Ramazzottius varieornatus]|uniref:Uncharacterized protein n=1 Tax=Ramazzottius varieornatus TaxID=947166 RepID=A0A1D1VJX1_RAMVA|nr:hypothetical protein RvY_12545 [Ramazzottius varieornatus]